jgi:hypothetical protein
MGITRKEAPLLRKSHFLDEEVSVSENPQFWNSCFTKTVLMRSLNIFVFGFAVKL